ncbi:RHS repeat-associated core domain-containing protein [Lignipirellula cremea]|uniref:RHS repeat-associated core domain-containing protein n=1 Tax=Lignipirellula cremea TaxID=2528010 RepID=UPI0037043F43
MYQYRHRYFSPVLGRFLGRDPINGKSGREQFFIQPNYYLYCSSRPISFTDPDGQRGHPNLDDQRGLASQYLGGPFFCVSISPQVFFPSSRPFPRARSN